MSITLPVSAIKTRLEAAIPTAFGAADDWTPWIYDTDPSKCFAKVKRGYSYWVLVVFRQVEQEENWAARTRTWSLPIDIYYLLDLTDNTDPTGNLLSGMDSLIDTLLALGNRWSGVTDMNHVDFSMIDTDHELAIEWRESVRWESAKLTITLRFDYVQG